MVMRISPMPRFPHGVNLVCGLALLLALTQFAKAGTPLWWATRGAVITNEVVLTNDFAAANLGQLKNMATAAAGEFQDRLAGGAGTGVLNMVNGFTQSNNYAGVTLGQLKAVAQPFYERLAAAGWPCLLPDGMSTNQLYPWTGTGAQDFAVGNLGQMKYVFSFNPITVDLDTDTDNDGTIDLGDSGEDRFEEYWPGRILCVNGFGIDTNTDYLAEIKLAIKPALSNGTAKLEALTNSSCIKVWTTTNKAAELTLPATWNLASTNPPSGLYVDGIVTGKVQLALSYTSGNGSFSCTDKVAMLIIPPISYSPGKGANAFVWAPLMTTSNRNSGNNLGWGDATEFENQIKDQGWPTVTWFTDTTGDTDANFGSCTLANYKGMTNCGIFTVVSHGEQGGHPVVYAEYSAAGEAALTNWCAGETGITVVPWDPDPLNPPWTNGCYVARVSSSWMTSNWKSAMDANRAIGLWSICYSATSNSATGEAAVKESAGGRWRSGYIDTTYETEAQGVNERLLGRMNGSTDSARKRTAGEAYETGNGYTSNVKMDGNDWTTLCPAPFADNAAFPNTTTGNRKGWGCIILDTYMCSTNAASDALMKVTGCPTSNHRWFGNSDGIYGLGFDYDKTGGAATTMRAVADKCRSEGLGGGRELDGDRVEPSKDDRDWSY